MRRFVKARILIGALRVSQPAAAQPPPPYQDGEEMLGWLAAGASPDHVLARLKQRDSDIGQW